MADMTTTQAMAHCPTSAAKTTFLTAADTFLTALDTMKTAADSGNAGVWTAAIAGSPTGGTYTLTLTGASRIAAQTVTLAFNAPAADVQTAIRALVGENLSQTTVTATGTTPNFTHTIQFKGTKADITVTTNIASLTCGSPSRTLTEVEEFERKTLHPVGGDMFKENVVDLMEVLATNMEV
jgi:hypothetical protein